MSAPLNRAGYPADRCRKCHGFIDGGPGCYWHIASTLETCPNGGFAEPEHDWVAIADHVAAKPPTGLFGTVVCRYERTATAERTIVHPEADGWPHTTTGEPT